MRLIYGYYAFDSHDYHWMSQRRFRRNRCFGQHQRFKGFLWHVQNWTKNTIFLDCCWNFEYCTFDIESYFPEMLQKMLRWRRWWRLCNMWISCQLRLYQYLRHNCTYFDRNLASHWKLLDFPTLGYNDQWYQRETMSSIPLLVLCHRCHHQLDLSCIRCFMWNFVYILRMLLVSFVL